MNIFFSCCSPSIEKCSRNVDDRLNSINKEKTPEIINNINSPEKDTIEFKSNNRLTVKSTLPQSKILENSVNKTEEDEKDNKDDFMFNSYVKKTTKINERDENKNIRLKAPFKHKAGIMMPPIVNNINNININIHQEVLQNPNETKKKSNQNSNINSPTNSNNTHKKQKSQNKSKIQQLPPTHKSSSISFSNMVIKKINTLSNNSINICDTEILNTCEIIFIGEIFGGKEIAIDRLGIKSQVGENNKRMKKDGIIRFGILKEISNDNKGNKDNKDNKDQDVSKQENSKANDSDLDVILSFSKSKHQKIVDGFNKEKQFSTNIKSNQSNDIGLFLVQYNPVSEYFEFFSLLNEVPVELLLNFEYNLSEGRNYVVLVGTVTLNLKSFRNSKEETEVEVTVKDDGNKKYIFNSNSDKMPITIGRANCSINISNISVSKIHSQIKYDIDKDEFNISDCKSTNGTYLKMRGLLSELQISRDFQFRIAETRFAVKYVNSEY